MGESAEPILCEVTRGPFAHPLMKKKKITLNDVMAANLLVRERGSGTRTAVEKLLREEGHAAEFGSEVSSNEAIKRQTIAERKSQGGSN